MSLTPRQKKLTTMLFTAIVEGNAEHVQAVCTREDVPAPSFIARAVASMNPAVHSVVQAAFPLPPDELAAMMLFVFAVEDRSWENVIAPYQQQWKSDAEYTYAYIQEMGSAAVWLFRGFAMKHIRQEPYILQIPWLKAEVDARSVGKLWTVALRRICTAEVLADLWVARAQCLPVKRSKGVVCHLCGSHYACSHTYVQSTVN
jgi:hypothetical protein